jgi:tetratricopeptide (TPR) repeat protein
MVKIDEYLQHIVASIMFDVLIAILVPLCSARILPEEYGQLMMSGSCELSFPHSTCVNNVPKRIFFLIALLGYGIAVPAASAQVLLPYTLQQDQQDLSREAQRLYNTALALTQLQQYDQALSRAALAAQLAPGRADIWLLLGTLYVQDKKIDLGIASLNKAQRLNPKSADALFILGSAFFQKGDFNTAIQKLQAGLRISPDNLQGLFDLGNAYYRSKSYLEAVRTYEKAVAKKKDFWPALNNIGLISYELGKLPEATQAWQRSIDIDKKAAEPQLALAVALYQQGKQAEAFRLGATALRNDSRYASIDYLQENLWGNKLLADTQKFLQTPQMRAALTLGDPDK